MQFVIPAFITLCTAAPYYPYTNIYPGTAVGYPGVGVTAYRGQYNPLSPYADFCYGNSNCINGYPV